MSPITVRREFCVTIYLCSENSLIIDVELAVMNHTKIGSRFRNAAGTDRTMAQALPLTYTQSFARFLSHLETRKRANRRDISFQFFVEHSCKVSFQTLFTYPIRQQNQATPHPVYGNYFFDEVEKSLDSTIGEDTPGRHIPNSNYEPINIENNAINRTSSIGLPLRQQSFAAWMLTMNSISIHECDVRRNRAPYIQTIKAAFLRRKKGRAHFSKEFHRKLSPIKIHKSLKLK